ncbi:hypothetical protein Tcan_00968, partial [Toxocara canis]
MNALSELEFMFCNEFLFVDCSIGTMICEPQHLISIIEQSSKQAQITNESKHQNVVWHESTNLIVSEVCSVAHHHLAPVNNFRLAFFRQFLPAFHSFGFRILMGYHIGELRSVPFFVLSFP